MSSDATRPNPFWSLLVWLGKAINFVNHLVFNVLMLVVLLLVFALIGLGMAANSGAAGMRPLQDKTALVLELKGNLVEQYTSNPLSRAWAQANGSDDGRELQLRDLVKGIKAAKTDDRIRHIVLLTDGFDTAGFAALRELGA